MPRVGYLGPPGTFSEQALMTQADLAASELVDLASITDVIDAVVAGDVDLGVVPLENAIEGAVNVTLDTITFDADVLIQREIVISVQMNLLGLPGAQLADIERVLSIPIATAQCRSFLRKELNSATMLASNSTAEAARQLIEEGDNRTAAIGTALAAEIYGLEVLAVDIEDHPENETRFGVLARDGIPGPTGHDKTTIVVFQKADEPGSLLTILQEFAARAINLTNLHSRPTKRGLGNYCFLIELEGHLSDELVADCLRDLKSKQADVKFLGSYPAASAHGETLRRDADAKWRAADVWLGALRAQVPPGR
ncbi:MAG: prephenate dehydratase [Acidimicrobiaceae bacterium]|jgi:prephenate dehydratase